MATITLDIFVDTEEGLAPATGELVARPIARRIESEGVVLPNPVVVELLGNPAQTMILDDTDGTWAWLIAEPGASKMRTFAVSGDANYSDLVAVDPDTLLPLPDFPTVGQAITAEAVARAAGDAANAAAITDIENGLGTAAVEDATAFATAAQGALAATAVQPAALDGEVATTVDDPESATGAALRANFAPRTNLPVIATAGDSVSSYEANNTTAFSRLGPLMAGDRIQDWTLSAAGGYTLAQVVSDRLPILAAYTPTPTAILLAGGTNDMGTGSITNAVTALHDGIDYILAMGATPILWAPPPRDASAGGTYNADTARYASYVRGIGAREGYRVLDAHRLLANSTGTLDSQYNLDGVHPNYAGHLVLARAYRDIVRELYPRTLNQWLTSPLGPEKSASVGLFLTDSNADGRADGVGSYGSPTGSLVAGAPVGQWQRSSVTSSVAANGGLRFEFTGLTAGNVYEFAYVFEGDMATASTAISASTYATWRSSGAQIAVVGAAFGSGRANVSSKLLASTDRLYCYFREACPTGADRMRIDFSLSGTPTANVYAQVAQLTVRDITALGLT